MGKKSKVNINDNSVDSAGIPKDYKEAITELIWNGYDARASTIKIVFNANEIDTVNEVSIIDNGDGIRIDNIGETFGAFLDSLKKSSFQRSSYVRGKKGKGRFSFTTFAAKAIWNTIFKTSDDKFLSYNITIDKNTKDTYSFSDQVVSKTKATGTTLVLKDLFDVTAYSFSSDDFKAYLSQEFGWFLLLNKNNDFKLLINGEPLQYDYLIAETDLRPVDINDGEGNKQSFMITYVRWNEAIGDKYYFYFLDNDKKENSKQLTSYNNQGIGFHHSLYIQSSYFDKFNIGSTESASGDMFGVKNANDPVFKNLLRHLQTILEEKRKGFVRENAATKLIQKYETKGILPPFRNNKYDQERRQDLITTIKEIYSVQPKIFIGLNEEQEKTCVGFLNLLLDSEERERIIEIIDNVVKLTKEERNDLITVIRKSSLSNIVRTIKLIESRYLIVESLKTLLFDLQKFTTEREHVQKAYNVP
jgi:hypothetical protein